MVTISPDRPTPETAQVIAMIRYDIRDGLYNEAAAPLDSFTALHDYVDANSYLDQACPMREDEDCDSWYARMEEVACEVDAMLAADPIPVR